ncbi:MAG: pyruvate dehydrogenase (acetyl-transferring), homodimeric type [Vulcanimicrobiaceae bacterium]
MSTSLSTPRADGDPQETREWLDALDGVLAREGPARAKALLERLVERAQFGGAQVELGVQTPYVNTIPPALEAKIPGNQELETRIRHYIRWNAMAMVVRANETSSELGGHVASFASSATLYDVGFNHFFRGTEHDSGGDLVYFQGHSSPGVYARAFLEGRISAEQLANFRQEVGGKGLSSYPHVWLMPEFWQFATVSMGLGPIQAIYAARFLKYLEHRGIARTDGRKVWCFLGDGEVDEPEALGAISLASREDLDNLIFVVNCNLQRLDGPVRGNGKIIQELERQFRGTGWNVIKVIWGSNWDTLLERDRSGQLVRIMTECVDGEYQAFKANDGAFVRKHFFERYPEAAALVADLSNEQIWGLQRGGHDPRKVYAAYEAALRTRGLPSVILAKTIKGYGLGSSGEAQNIAHQQKHLDLKAMRAFRDRFAIPIADAELAEVPFYRPPDDSPEAEYLRERTAALGRVPARRPRSSVQLVVPELSAFTQALTGTGEREISTTMALVRMLVTLMRDPVLGARIVPIVADESRTFGMEGLFRQFGIYAPQGQRYRPQDAEQLMYYREDVRGQILQEGISEAGGISSWIAAATAYSTSDQPMIPFFFFYSMFGFQRVGDLAWAAGDMRSRGFLVGGTSGRTTLNGEGLQHQDGHSQLFASFIPNCVSYDPAYAYELAVIVRDGLRRMVAEQEDVFYYLTVLNENYAQPPLPGGSEAAILRGLHLVRPAGDGATARVQLFGSGAILREALAAADLLAVDFGVGADVWSATSFNELRRDGLAVERWNLLHSGQPARRSFVEASLEGRPGPVVAASDYLKALADGIRPFVPRPYRVLGTDGYGRSDYRRTLRAFFEVDRRWIALAAVASLAEEGTLKRSAIAQAMKRYELDPEKPAPVSV